MENLKFKGVSNGKLYPLKAINPTNMTGLCEVEGVRGWTWNSFEKFVQFTGLHDKNRKEIYNGDIVRCHKFTQEVGENLGIREGEREFIAVIESTVYGGVQVVLPNGEFMFIWEHEEGWHEESLEVIGNIYENPELYENL